MSAVRFFSEDTPFKLARSRKTTQWIKESIARENKQLVELNFIFCSDEYLRQINIQYLNHTTYTDIVTFDNSDHAGHLEGDIYISIDRVRENAEKFDKTFDDELHRVIIHGVLHLTGYSDKGEAQKKKMRQKEDMHLSFRGSFT